MINDKETAISTFKLAYPMYANVDLEATRTPEGWNIYIPGVQNPIGKVDNAGTAQLYWSISGEI